MLNRIPKAWTLLAVFVVSVMGAGAWVFTTPPDYTTNQTGDWFGNTSNNGNNYTADRIEVMNYFGTVVGTYLDSYSCSSDYCVYKPWYDSGRVYAKNVSTGKIDYSGTDAYTVIQSALNIGDIYIRDGTYTLSNSLNPKNHSIMGQSWDTILIPLSFSNTAIIDADVLTNSTISSITLDGNGYKELWGVPAIRIIAPQSVEISNTQIMNTSSQGILFGNSGCYDVNKYYSGFNNTFGNQITNNYIHDIGLNLTASGCGKGIQIFRNDNVLISENYIINTTSQAIQAAESYNITVTNNNARNNTEGGIWLSYGTSFSKATDNTVIDSIGAYYESSEIGLCVVDSNYCPSTRNRSTDNLFSNNIAYTLNPTFYTGYGFAGSYGEVKIDNNIFRTKYGIVFDDENYTSGLPIQNLTVSRNIIEPKFDGIVIHSSNRNTMTVFPVSIKNNDIYSGTNGNYGIYLNISNSTYNEIIVEGNTITKMNRGIYVNSSVPGNISNLYIRNNIITGSTNRGMFIKTMGANISTLDVSHNTVNGSTASQIDIQGNISNVTVNYNTVKGTASGQNGIGTVQGTGASMELRSMSHNTFIDTVGTAMSITVTNNNYVQIDNAPISPLYYGNRASCTVITGTGSGDYCYNTTSKAFNTYNGATWQYYNGTYVNAY